MWKGAKGDPINLWDLSIKDAKINSHPGFITAFDNINIHLGRREMIMSVQNLDIHCVNHEVLQNSVSQNSIQLKILRHPLQMFQILHSFIGTHTYPRKL